MCVYLNVLGIAYYLKLPRKILRKGFIPFQIHAPSPIQTESKLSFCIQMPQMSSKSFHFSTEQGAKHVHL